MAIEFTNWFPMLPVKDERAGVKFYKDALGFQLDWERYLSMSALCIH